MYVPTLDGPFDTGFDKYIKYVQGPHIYAYVYTRSIRWSVY